MGGLTSPSTTNIKNNFYFWTKTVYSQFLVVFHRSCIVHTSARFSSLNIFNTGYYEDTGTLVSCEELSKFTSGFWIVAAVRYHLVPTPQPAGHFIVLTNTTSHPSADPWLIFISFNFVIHGTFYGRVAFNSPWWLPMSLTIQQLCQFCQKRL